MLELGPVLLSVGRAAFEQFVMFAGGRHMTAEGNHVRAVLVAAYLDEAGAIPKP